MEEEDHRVKEELDAWEPQEGGGGPAAAEVKAAGPSASSSAARRSRRSAQKKVVAIPVGETEGFRQKNGAGGEVFQPTDSWAWRKYGQKPIKGSPHPRGYYRCSSCKGCPARKQVERSRLDPAMLIVTYSFEHNHAWPLPKHTARPHHNQPPKSPPLPTPQPSQGESGAVIRDQEPPPPPPLLMIDDDGGFRWVADVASPSSTSAGSDALLYGSVHFGRAADAAVDLMPQEEAAVAAEGEEEEEDSLFAGLEELPEYTVVFRRGLAAAAAAPWTGATG